MNPHPITLFIKHLFLSDSSFPVLISWPFEYELHLTYLQSLPIFTFFSWPFVCQLTFLLWWLCSLQVSSAEYTRLFRFMGQATFQTRTLIIPPLHGHLIRTYYNKFKDPSTVIISSAYGHLITYYNIKLENPATTILPSLNGQLITYYNIKLT